MSQYQPLGLEEEMIVFQGTLFQRCTSLQDQWLDLVGVRIYSANHRGLRYVISHSSSYIYIYTSAKNDYSIIYRYKMI